MSDNDAVVVLEKTQISTKATVERLLVEAGQQTCHQIAIISQFSP